MRLRDCVAIITGSGRGIGKEMANIFSREGASVVVNDVEQKYLKECTNSIKEQGGKATGVICDVSDADAVKKMVDVCLDEYGKIDILVNNAGTALGDVGDKFLEGLPRDIWQRTLDVNLIGAINCTMEVMPHMIERKYGKIVIISSAAGRYSSLLSGPYYAASKGGQLAFTRQMALKLGPYGIYVNAIAPGSIDSGDRALAMWLAKSEEEREQILNKIPLRRRGKPEDVANVALFLASDESGYVTGVTIDCNGGLFMS